jgi:hypothetical protein
VDGTRDEISGKMRQGNLPAFWSFSVLSAVGEAHLAGHPQLPECFAVGPQLIFVAGHRHFHRIASHEGVLHDVERREVHEGVHASR